MDNVIETLKRMESDKAATRAEYVEVGPVAQGYCDGYRSGVQDARLLLGEVAAMGCAWEELGAKITAAGQEDSSGYRRMLARLLARREFGRVAECLRISETEAEALRASFVRDFGEASDGRL